MGLASSQARLLNLSTRMHQIEYKAAKLEAQKLQMANESRKAYLDYQNALEKTKVQYRTINTDGSSTYQDIKSYEDFLNAGYAICFKGVVYDGSDAFINDEGKIIWLDEISPEEYNANVEPPSYPPGYVPSIPPGIDMFYKVTTEDGTVDYKKIRIPGSSIDIFSGEPINLTSLNFQGSVYTKSPLDYARLCAKACGADIDNPPANVSEVITNLINTGDVTIVEKRKDFTFPHSYDEDFSDYETSVATNTGLQEVADESGLRKAEAKYEADMRRIDYKDRKYDYDLAALEAERNAIKNEMETLKTVAKDNVERTFKLFG